MGAHGVRGDRVRVIHYGINPEPFVAPPEGAKARWNLSGRPVATAIGRLTPHRVCHADYLMAAGEG